jgi:rhomboid family protein
MTPWVGFLLLANGVVYVLLELSPEFKGAFAFLPAYVMYRPWTLVTYMFVHANFGHIFWNMVVLYFFGPRVEGRLGPSRFIGLYLVSGFAGALLSFIDPMVPIIGASGAIFGVELAYARYWPRDRIYIWGILPVEAWILVIVMAAVSLFGGLGRVGNVAHWAHLGGFAGAALYLVLIDRFSPGRRFRTGTSSPPKPGLLGERGAPERWKRIRGEDLHEVNRAELERIRQVLADKGVAGLTADDRAFLDRFSNR